jgi:PadR family transcriptional regulator AphA
MSLKHVILVSLQRRPASGYDLKEEFAAGLHRVWRTSHQAIYRALAAMQREGLVAFSDAPQPGRPDKKIYRLTRRGEAALQHWLARGQAPTHLNEELMIKFYAGELCPPETLREQVAAHRQAHRRNLESLLRIESAMAPAADLSRGERIQAMTLRRGILTEQARLAWCDEALALLDEA